MSERDDLDPPMDPINPMENRDDKIVAAEYALGLLEGEELLTARGRMAHDATFADRKAWWDNWFAPWTDEMAGIEPSDQVWENIDARVHAALEQPSNPVSFAGPLVNDTESSDTVVDLRSRLRNWQWTAGLTSAAAAVALAFIAFGNSASAPTPGATGAPQFASADPLVASIPIGETQLRLGVTFLPDSDEMLVSASGLTADGVHDHELWLVPADGSDLQSLGVVVAGEERRVELPANIARNMGDGVGLVLTREPLGGKPDGVDAGPVVAQGALSQV